MQGQQLLFPGCNLWHVSGTFRSRNAAHSPLPPRRTSFGSEGSNTPSCNSPGASTDVPPIGCGSRLNHQTAGFSLGFHLPGIHFGYLFFDPNPKLLSGPGSGSVTRRCDDQVGLRGGGDLGQRGAAGPRQGCGPSACRSEFCLRQADRRLVVLLALENRMRKFARLVIHGKHWLMSKCQRPFLPPDELVDGVCCAKYLQEAAIKHFAISPFSTTGEAISPCMP